MKNFPSQIDIIRGQYARLEAFSEARLQAHLDALLAPFV